jgi:hypothetical protein
VTFDEMLIPFCQFLQHSVAYDTAPTPDSTVTDLVLDILEWLKIQGSSLLVDNLDYSDKNDIDFLRALDSRVTFSLVFSLSATVSLYPRHRWFETA